MLTTFLFVAGWLAGLLVGESGLVGLAPAIGASVLGLVGALVGRPWPAARRFFAVVLGLGLGAGRLLLAQPQPEAAGLSAYVERGPVVVRGLVIARPDILSDEQRLRVRVAHVAGADFESDLRGDILVFSAGYPRYEYGDELLLTGALLAPPRLGQFDYPQYLTRQGIQALMRRPQTQLLARGRGSPLWLALYCLKDQIVRTSADILPAPHGALLAAMLVGDRSGIPARLNEAFRVVGVSHIIVISGWNIAILVSLLNALFAPWLGRRPALWVALGATCFYVALVGFDPPVVRAAIMGGLALLAILAGRQALALLSLALAAWLMTVIRPYVLWDLGFQLSFAATAGLILFAPSLSRASHRLLGRLGLAPQRRLVRFLDETIIVTIAAQMLVVPLLIYRLGNLSLLMLPANLLLVPFAPLTLGLGALATLGGLLWLPLGRLLGWLAWPFLAYLIGVTETAAKLPGAALPLPPLSPAALFVYYAGMAGLVLLLRQNDPDALRQLWLRARRRLSAYLAPAALGLSAILIWAAVLAQPDGKLHIYFLDVGQGDAIFVRTPSGRQMLIDGGPDGPTLLAELSRRMPFWDHRLDVILATHADDDHIAGLFALLERRRVDVALDADIPLAAEAGQRWAAALTAQGTRRQPISAGARIAFSDGVEVQILHPPADAGPLLAGNDRSVAARLTYGNFSLLLTGDLEAAGEEALLRSGQPLASSVLKVAHHGAATGSSPAFLDAVAPAAAVISAGAGNRFGHPAAATLRRLEARGVRVWRTDRQGEIELISDGTRLWVRSRR